MTGDKTPLLEFERKANLSVSSEEGNMGQTLGYGNTIIENVIIQNVALVEGLKHNLSSISQITNRSYHVVFYELHCKVVHSKTKKIALKEYRFGNVYEANLHANTDGPVTCLISKASVDGS